MHEIPGIGFDKKPEPRLKWTTPDITYFFREPSALATIVTILAPRVGDTVVVASVGCSSGMEVYSLLLLNSVFSPERKLLVHGYDNQEELLEQARTGICFMASTAVSGHFGEILSQELGIEPELLSTSPSKVTKDLRMLPTFLNHDITQGPLPAKYPIIICANVLYHYLGFNLDQILTNLASSLEPGGYLLCEDISPNRDLDPDYIEALESHPAFIDRRDLVRPVYNWLKRDYKAANLLQLAV